MQLRRTSFVALLVLVPLLGHLSSNGFDYPAVSNIWSCLPFCVLLALPLLDANRIRSLFALDLLVLLSLVVALGCQSPSRVWPFVLVYPPLAYLAVRMVVVARGRRASVVRTCSRPLLPTSWLVAGIIVLAGVHVDWALQASAQTDVGNGGVAGALRIIHGNRLYGVLHGPTGVDVHTDTYGPLNYEAYIPFAVLFSKQTAAYLTTLFFDLLTAVLLFLLGRRLRNPRAGVLLAYCWLAFPFTLYEDAFGFNDSLVAASLVAAMLLAQSPVRRGVMAALAAWVKLSPLALVPLLAGYRGSSARRTGPDLSRFAAAFCLASILVFLPALTHSTIQAFVSRTFDFQAGRPAALSIWAYMQMTFAVHTPWIAAATHVIHGLIAAVTAAFAILATRGFGRQDVVGLAATSAALLIAIEICLSYYSFSYILWFAPLVLVALLLDEPTGRSVSATESPKSALA